MRPRGTKHPRDLVRGGLTGAAWLAAGICLAAVWQGCSAKRDYKVLSFFFDGVPDPNAIVSNSAPGGAADIRQSPTFSIHKPYADEKCSECHSGRQVRIGSNDATVCLKCHQEKLAEHPVMHGPVVAGACLWCHNPHQSAYAALFKAAPREVCTQCHTNPAPAPERVPQHADPAASCLDCHFGHGGDQRYFLRPGIGSPPPPDTEEPGRH